MSARCQRRSVSQTADLFLQRNRGENEATPGFILQRGAIPLQPLDRALHHYYRTEAGSAHTHLLMAFPEQSPAGSNSRNKRLDL